MKPIIKKILIILSIVILLLVITNLGMKIHSNNSSITNVESTLDKVLKINELHSYEYTFNSFVVAYTSKFNIETYEQYKDFSNIIEKMVEAIKIKEKNEDTKQSDILYQEYSNDIIEVFEEAEKKLSKDNFFKTLKQIIDQEIINDILQNAKDEAQNELNVWKDLQIYAPNEAQKDVLELDFPNLKKYLFDYSFTTIKEIFSICHNYSELKELSNFLKLNKEEAMKYNKKKYAVSYEGSVRAGIDEPLELKLVSENKIIVYIPKIKILDFNVDIPTDYKGMNKIEFINGSTEHVEWYKEAKLLSEQDLLKKVSNDENFLNLAEENLHNTVKSLIEPFVPEYITVDILSK